jgi:hypothetical protein
MENRGEDTVRATTFMVTALLFLLACSGLPYGEVVAGEYWVYLPDHSDNINPNDLRVEPVAIDDAADIHSTLDAIAGAVSEMYFSRYGRRSTSIKVVLDSVHYVWLSTRPIRIGIFDVIDTDSVAMRTFFQGSSGAQLTFDVLVANLVQPQMNPALLDGAIVLYNGELISEMDHIDLSGILTPGMISGEVYAAMKKQRR